MSNSKKGSSLYELRPSSVDPSKLINNNGDFAKFYTSTHANVNGNHSYTKKSIENALNRIGNKRK